MWIYVGTSKKSKDILVEIVKEVAPSSSEELIKDKDEDQLAHIIHEFLIERGKYLIVLDDVWDTKVVDFVKKAFPNNESQPRGDRIMFTTRQRLWLKLSALILTIWKNCQKGIVLSCWNREFFGKTRECPIKLRGYGNEIVDKCCGVPHAIVVIVGALRGCLGESEWKLVKDNVGKHLISKDDHKSCLKFVQTSYNHLPQQRKAAFLYFGVFPQGFDIPAWKLILLWVAEGLIKSDLQGSEIEEVAETYLSNFAGRNLVMVMQKRSNGQIKTYRLHDMLYEFCIIEVERISLFQQVTPDSCKKTVLAKVCHLRKLGIEGQLAFLLGKSTKGRGFDSFQELRCIENLKLLNNGWSEELHLPPHFFSLQKTLNKLTLSNTNFEWSEADMLGQLECLTVLKLKENAFIGKNWKPKKGSFSNLQVLQIVWAENWGTWDASNRPFQSLTHLVLISCYDLKVVPHELADLPYLQEMRPMRTFKAVSSAIEIKSKKLRRQDPESSIKFNLIIFPPPSSTN
uniref:Putative disease resistance protein, identical n=1 Tax=Solanum tuberosum TaxID=4113 RepID=Q60CX9_SOLTU|nr:Putative disease resistance protein, identical [Solanum tuberosum]